METITLGEICEAIGGELVAEGEADRLRIAEVSTDSRRIFSVETLFVALPGGRTDGHRFVDDAAGRGAAGALVSTAWRRENKPGLACVVVEDTFAALQKLAGWYRRRFDLDVLGITGSNGKTTVKDLIAGILGQVRPFVASPGSYNSGLGVALSLLRIESRHEIALIEAGISETGEMPRLETMIRPTCGLLTNIGPAHIGGFGSRTVTAREKMQLFQGIGRNIGKAGWVLVPADEPLALVEADALECEVHRFGPGGDASLPRVDRWASDGRGGLRVILAFPDGLESPVILKAPSPVHVRNLEAAAAAAYLFGATPDQIIEAMDGFEPGPMRMEIWRSREGVTIVNDTYCADPASVSSALSSMSQITTSRRRVFVFGGMRDLGPHREREHQAVGELAAREEVDLLVLVGEACQEQTAEAYRENKPDGKVFSYETNDAAAAALKDVLEPGDAVLIKGPRQGRLEVIARQFLETMAPNRLHVNLAAIEGNIQRIRSLLKPGCRMLAVVKALAYGLDAIRLSRFLANCGVDYLGVASPDEGVVLRKSGVDLPILVMHTPVEEAEKIASFHLSAAVDSPDLVKRLSREAERAGHRIKVHLFIDTGMGTQGVAPEDAGDLAAEIARLETLELEGVMTHFAAPDDPGHDAFTRDQIDRFTEVCEHLAKMGIEPPIRHAAATAAAIRFPEAHFDMVRIGIGLYGLYNSEAVETVQPLECAVALVSRLTQVRGRGSGSTIGYGRSYVVENEGQLAGRIPLGYHDGLPRHLSNCGVVMIKGRPAPICGRVCMDLTMVDVSGIPDVRPGDEVLIFGERDGVVLRPEEVAATAGTIAHDLLACIGPRVQRVYENG